MCPSFFVFVFILVVQLYVIGSAYDQLPSLGADTENISQLKQKSLSGAGKAESDFFVVADVQKTKSPPCQLKPRIKATVRNTDTCGMIFLSLASLRCSG